MKREQVILFLLVLTLAELLYVYNSCTSSIFSRSVTFIECSHSPEHSSGSEFTSRKRSLAMTVVGVRVNRWAAITHAKIFLATV